MATEDCKELLSGDSQPENVENDLYNDVNITASLITSEKNEEAFQNALKDDYKADENANASQEIAATTEVDGHEKADGLGDNNVETDKTVEAVNSSSNKKTKKIVKKRKKNVEEASAHTVSSSPKVAKKKMNDASALKVKEVPPHDISTEGNAKKEVKIDDKLESTGKSDEDEVEKADGKYVKVGKKVEGTANKAVKLAKKKFSAKAKGKSSNAESAPTKLPNVVATKDTCTLEEDAKQDAKNDEKLASTTKNTFPEIEEKDAEGTKGEPTTPPTDKKLKKDHTAEKRLKNVDGMGLIFMCNAKTKKDCFKYNIFGLPESKKALVAQIYKGMRLFLFDFDLKLLYGIYKAASPGGYNIEPKAFDSKFPSQVRFTVLRDSIPLPEEKFKAAIKENYTRNKFDCQLSPEQVRKLCKLFQNATSGSSMQTHRPVAVREVAMPSSRTRGPKRRHVRREAYPSPPRFYRHSPPRAHYPSPPRATLPRPLFAPLQPSYTYERPGGDYYYSRDYQRRVLDLEMRPRDLPIDYHDSYNPYMEPVLYREPAYPPSLPLAYPARLREPRSPPRYLY